MAPTIWAGNWTAWPALRFTSPIVWAPAIFTGVYLALVYSWLATIGAEYLLVSGRGVGNLLIEGSEHFRMDLVLFGMVTIGVVGWLMNASARTLERALARRLGR